MFTSKTIKHSVQPVDKDPKLDGTASKPRKLVELPTEEEDIHPETDSGWCIDHGEPLPERKP